MTDAELDAALEKALLKKQLRESIAEDRKKEGVGPLMDAIDYGPGFLADTFRAAGQGVMKIPSALASLVTLPASLFADDPKKLPGNKTAKAFDSLAERTIPLDFEGMTPAEKSWFKGTSDTATGFGLSGPSSIVKAPLATLATNAMGTVGANLGGEFGKKTGIPGGEVSGNILGSLLLGVPTGFGLGPKLSPVQDDLRQATKNLTPQDMAEALSRAQMFERGGSTTHTLADAFGPHSSVATLANTVKNSELGNPFQTRLAGRTKDLTDLANRYLDNVYPTPVEPAAIANQLSGAANSTLATSKGLRGTALANRLAVEPPVLPQEMRQLHTDLMTHANGGRLTPAEAEPFRIVARALETQDGSVITTPQQASLALKKLKEADRNPLQQNIGGAAITPGFLRDAINAVEARFRQMMPGYGPAMDEFRDFTRRGLAQTPGAPGPRLQDLNEGPLGRLADRNPNLDFPTPESKLGVLTSPSYSPDTVEGLARTLSNSTMTGNPQAVVDPLQVLRARGQLQLAADPTNPGAVLGNGAEERIARVLTSQGQNADDVLAPARAGRELTPGSASGMNITPRMAPIQAAIRLLRTLDMTVTRAGQKAYADELGAILAQPGSQETIGELQKLAMFDPEIRKKLTLLVPMIPGLLNAQEK